MWGNIQKQNKLVTLGWIFFHDSVCKERFSARRQIENIRESIWAEMLTHVNTNIFEL